MRRIVLLFIAIVTISLTGCSLEEDSNGFTVDKKYDLVPLETVMTPLPESEQDPDIVGVQLESVDISDVEWDVFFDNSVYQILSREVPDGMLFYSIGYGIEQWDDGKCSCNIGAYHRFKYVIFYEDEYYDFYDFHLKYNNLSCTFLVEIGIYSSNDFCNRS